MQRALERLHIPTLLTSDASLPWLATKVRPEAAQDCEPPTLPPRLTYPLHGGAAAEGLGLRALTDRICAPCSRVPLHLPRLPLLPRALLDAMPSCVSGRNAPRPAIASIVEQGPSSNPCSKSEP